jgi:hypothetical protein
MALYSDTLRTTLQSEVARDAIMCGEGLSISSMSAVCAARPCSPASGSSEATKAERYLQAWRGHGVSGIRLFEISSSFCLDYTDLQAYGCQSRLGLPPCRRAVASDKVRVLFTSLISS